MKPVKLTELIDNGLECVPDEHLAWVDLETGSVVCLSRELIAAVEQSDEEALAGLAEWEKNDAALATAIVGDSGARFVRAPTKFDFDEYRQMERFIGTVENSEAAERLWRAIKGKGAFRRFKDTAERLGLLKQWFAHRDEALKRYVRGWAEAHHVPILEDTPPQAPSCGAP